MIQVEKLKQCLEDITSVCILEGFQKQVLQECVNGWAFLDMLHSGAFDDGR